MPLIEPGGTDVPPEDRRRTDGELPPLLKRILARVLGHGHAAGVPAQDTPFPERRTIMNSKKLLAL